VNNSGIKRIWHFKTKEKRYGFGSKISTVVYETLSTPFGASSILILLESIKRFVSSNKEKFQERPVMSKVALFFLIVIVNFLFVHKRWFIILCIDWITRF
jgi:divalent metal cation (Fe/Co/Zn/Cd) transporter